MSGSVGGQKGLLAPMPTENEGICVVMAVVEAEHQECLRKSVSGAGHGNFKGKSSEGSTSIGQLRE